MTGLTRCPRCNGEMWSFIDMDGDAPPYCTRCWEALGRPGKGRTVSEGRVQYRVNHEISQDKATQQALMDSVAAAARRLARPPDECIDYRLCVELGCCAAGCQGEPPDDPANFY